MLLLDTGLRASGIFSFKISNVDLTNTRLLIPHLFFTFQSAVLVTVSSYAKLSKTSQRDKSPKAFQRLGLGSRPTWWADLDSHSIAAHRINFGGFCCLYSSEREWISQRC